MSVLAIGWRALYFPADSRAPRFRIELFRELKKVVERLNDLDRSTPFQDPLWLTAWYDAFAGKDNVEPLIAVICDARTGEPVALLPLICRLHKTLRVVEFADLDLTDYNAPIMTGAAPRDPEAARTLWRELRAALRRMPEGADLIRLRKMPAYLQGGPNPFAQLNDVGPCSLNGNFVTTTDDFDAYRYSLERTVRKELERSWRVFTRNSAAEFKIITDKNEALRILSCMEMQQGKRMQHLGLPFILNGESCAAFFRKLIGNGVDSGYVVVSALTVGEEVVAALLGIRNGSHYVMVRISNAGGKWSNCSPGRLIIERSMAAMHKDGVRRFDFSVVDYPYKQRFGVARLELFDISAALSWRGWPYAVRDRAAYHLRRYPRIAYYVRCALGRAP